MHWCRLHQPAASHSQSVIVPLVLGYVLLPSFNLVSEIKGVDAPVSIGRTAPDSGSGDRGEGVVGKNHPETPPHSGNGKGLYLEFTSSG
jgi:hypothetical protein